MTLHWRESGDPRPGGTDGGSHDRMVLRAVRALAAAHAFGNATSVTEMRRVLKRIVQLCDGERA